MTCLFKYLKLLLPLASIVIAVSCGKVQPPATVDRVLMVYLAADNNMVASAWGNIDAIAHAMKGSSDNARTIVYIDTPAEAARIIEITQTGQKELYRWTEPQNSASGETLAKVIEMVRRMAPANIYGLVLWSHGLAWMPAAASEYISRAKGRIADPWPETKWFAQDVSSQPMAYIETDDLAQAIPPGIFDYILFDACFMGSVEVLYALRQRADYIISSPAEVIIEGFPYKTILTQMLRPKPDMKQICRSYYEYYANHNQQSFRAATVSLVKTDQLEALAEATEALYTKARAIDPEVFLTMDIAKLQRLDRYRRHFLFDMGSVVRHLHQMGFVTQAALDSWQTQLAKTIIYEAHTPKFFDITLDECCGMSTYVPLAVYEDLNEYYQGLEWSQIVAK